MDSLSEGGDWKSRTSLDLNSPFSSRELLERQVLGLKEARGVTLAAPCMF